MARYIDADKLEGELFRDGIAGIFLNYPRRVKFTIGEIRGMLKNERIAPTADVVEVVRCCECIHRKENPDIYNTCYLTCNLGHGLQGTVDPTDFCSYGERKECEGK